MSIEASRPPKDIPSSVLEKLRAIRTPVIYDALERYGIRSQVEGYTDGSIRCLLPALGSFVGFACTGRVTCAAPPASGEKVVDWRAVWEYVRAMARPSIAVVEDIDSPVGRGCVWGDVSAAIFQANGCVATVTNGSVRDIRAVEEMGFGLFAASAVVGHGYGRYVEIGGPVTIGGMAVTSGTLLHADEHGALTIPAEVDLMDLLKMVETVTIAERKVIDYCARADFDIAELDRMHTWSMHTSG
jgi:regulator of RNase E activity RraA